MRPILAIATLTAILGITGCVAAEKKQELDPFAPRKAQLAALERDATYQGHWRAASVCADLADEGTENLPRNERESYARRGKEHAEKAIALEDDGVEGHYYRALCIGRVLDAERLPSFTLVPVLRDEAERAAKLDDGFEHAGAHRMLGILYCKAPSWGPVSVGDEDKAEDHFKAALDVAGEWPENLLAYAEHLIKEDHCEPASKLLDQALKLADESSELTDGEKRSVRLEILKLRKEIEDRKP